MNPIVIAVIISSAAFIASIFAANWLNQQHVTRLIEAQGKLFQSQLASLERLFDERLKALEQSFNERFNSLERTINSRITALEQRMDARFDEVDRRFVQVEQRLKRLEDILFKPSLP